MVKQRIMTGILLAVFTILVIFLAPFQLFTSLLTLLILFAAWEFSLFVGLKKYLTRLIYVLIISIFIYCSLYIPIKLILWISLVWWCVACFLIITYPKTTYLWAKYFWIKALMGIFVLVPTWLALNGIKIIQDGNFILLFMLLLIWTADTGAYIVGKQFGRHYLMPKVSPGKTKEGVVGGLLLSLLVAQVAYLIPNMTFLKLNMMIIIGMIAVLFSVIGDLFESMLKRQIGVKDIGNYLPGHGGLLDRIDSLTAAAPIFLFGLLLIL